MLLTRTRYITNPLSSCTSPIAVRSHLQLSLVPWNHQSLSAVISSPTPQSIVGGRLVRLSSGLSWGSYTYWYSSRILWNRRNNPPTSALACPTSRHNSTCTVFPTYIAFTRLLDPTTVPWYWLPCSRSQKSLITCLFACIPTCNLTDVPEYPMFIACRRSKPPQVFVEWSIAAAGSSV
jgi:hypothetical protein